MSAAPVWALLEAFRGGGGPAPLRPLHPDVEISDPERTGAGPSRGHAAYLAWVEDWMDTWDHYELQLEAPVVAGDTVVALVRHRGRARGSGVEVDRPGALLYRVRDGLITSVRPYADRDDALEAAGLKEPAERFWESSVATWESYTFTPLAFEPHGNQILVVVRANTRARASGIELEEQWAHLFTLRDGELVRFQAFTSSEEAHAALAYPDAR